LIDGESSGLTDRILGLIKRSGEPKTASDIAKELGESYDNVAKALRKLAESNLVIACGFRPKEVGRPEILYTSLELITYARMADESDLSSFDERSKIIFREAPPTIDVIAKSLIEQFDPAIKKLMEEALRKAYIRLTKEDPVELLFQMARWTVTEFEKSVRDFVLADRDEQKRKAHERIIKLIDFGFKVFNKYLSIPGEKGQGPFRIGLDFDAGEIERRVKNGGSSETIIDELRVFRENEIREHLRSHVFGKAVFEKITTIPPNSYTIVSTDASVQYVVAQLSHSEFMESPRAAISAAVAAWYGVDGDKKEAFLDPYPDPRTWTKFVTEHAVREGYLIPPEMAIELDAYRWKRTVEAMMDLRHYTKDDLTMRAASGPLPQERWGVVYALVRDGRVFPWEHTIGDFAEQGPHGYFVRQCQMSFWRLVDLVNDFKEELLYGGAVKWSQIEMFTRLIFWYLKYGSALTGERLWKDDDQKYDDIYIFGRITTDQRLIKHAFNVLSEVIPKSNDERWITFRTIRRFYSLVDQDNLSLKKLDEEGWVKEIETYLKDKPAYTKREVLPYIRTYARLCAKGAVLSCYIQPTPIMPKDYPEEIIQIPRYEVLVPYGALENPDLLKKIDDAYIKRIAQVVADPRMMDIYPMRERFDLEMFLIFLKPARFAHEYVKRYAIDSKHQIFGLLVQRLSQLFPEKAKKQA
jgi:DNA-binding transcriptional ArsR family regulator